MSIDLRQAIEDQHKRKDAMDAALQAFEAASVAYKLGSIALTEALAKAAGYEVGKEIRLEGGGLAKIRSFHRHDMPDGSFQLIGYCHRPLKGGGWSKRANMSVNLKHPVI